MNMIRVGLILIFFSIAACSSLVLESADFAWPLESVLRVNNEGFVKEERHTLSFDARGLFFEEFGDSTAYLDRDIRIIRDTKGYYFITAQNFKSVYVFVGIDGKMNLNNKIEISEEGMSNPAFNQRPPFIELLNDGGKILLSNMGIENKEGGNEE
jgi:hypothetical protein